MTFFAGLFLGVFLGAAVLSWCVASEEFDVFFEGWKAGYRACREQQATFRRADEITVEKFLETL